MKYSNEEKTSSPELAIEYLESAIDELTGISEYKNICEELKMFIKIKKIEDSCIVFKNIEE